MDSSLLHFIFLLPLPDGLPRNAGDGTAIVRSDVYMHSFVKILPSSIIGFFAETSNSSGVMSVWEGLSEAECHVGETQGSALVLLFIGIKSLP